MGKHRFPSHPASRRIAVRVAAGWRRVVSLGQEPPSGAELLASSCGRTLPRSGLELPMSEAAWKAEKERIAQRNDAAQKAGKKERETQEREREARRRIAEVRRHDAVRKSHP